MSRTAPASSLFVLLALTCVLGACDRKSNDDPVPSGDVTEEDITEPDVDEDPEEDLTEDVEEDVEDDTAEDTGADADVDVGPACIPVPTDEAMLPTGPDAEGRLILPGGRLVSAPERSAELEGFPSNAVINAAGTRAYVIVADMRERHVQVVDLVENTVLQDLEVVETIYGIALDETGGRLYVSGGSDQNVHVFTVAEDGTLTLEQSVDVRAYVSGLALTPDGATLFIGVFNSDRVIELQTATIADESPTTLSREFESPGGVWDLHYVAARDQIIASSLDGATLRIFDRATGATHVIALGAGPLGFDVTADESLAYVAVSGTNEIAIVDLVGLTVTARIDAVSDELLGAEGEPLGRSNVNDVALSADGTRFFATRGADNAVSVFDTDGPTYLGAFPVSWYPTTVVASPDASPDVALYVAQGRGFRTGGLLSTVAINDLDLAAESLVVTANLERMRQAFPFECDGFFPIPTRPDVPTPIEHIILVVKENKTFDCVFGALEGVDGDPSLVRWGEDLTPNQHALARQFNISDNFYVETANSDQGHIVLTAGMLNDFSERMVNESRRTSLTGYQVRAEVAPEGRNLFTHLMDNDISLAIYGEIVGTNLPAADGRRPIQFSDVQYPGGPFYNMNARDSAKAQHVVDQIEAGNFAQFTYVLLPNDHTGGTAPGNPTPESEVADNDEAVGILVDYISHSEHWDSTLIIVLEDDPQGCRDHRDSFRSFILMISPWARRNYVSHVNASYQSVFATIYRILGVPPLGRTDATAIPMWDFFTGTPDMTPYDLIPRTVPERKIASVDVPGAEASLRMDFSGPDRNPGLGIVLDAYRLWRMGQITQEEAQRRIDAGEWSHPQGWDADDASRAWEEAQLEELEEEAEEEAEEELFEYDVVMTWYREHLLSQGLTPPGPTPGGPLDEATIQRIMSGDIAVEQVPALRGFQRTPALPTRLPTP